jgi:hypothetical protein
MRAFSKVILLAVLLSISVQTALAAPQIATERSAMERLLEGPRIVNIVDDFLAFWEQASDKPLAKQRVLWAQMVESKHQLFFDRAVYRTADRRERRALLNQFLATAGGRVDAIREFNNTFYSVLSKVFIDFKLVRFREYRQQRDIYVGISLFRFDGSVRPVQNERGVPDTLCVGADVMSTYTPEQVYSTLAHEFFHLYHFSYLFDSDLPLSTFRAAYVPLMIEGLAAIGVEEISPNQPQRYYLSFNEEEFQRQSRSISVNSLRFLKLIRSGATAEEYEPWFLIGSGGSVPPRGGYMLGYEVARRLRGMFTLEQLVQMSPPELKQLAEDQLSILANEGVVLMASSQ